MFKVAAKKNRVVDAKLLRPGCLERIGCQPRAAGQQQADSSTAFTVSRLRQRFPYRRRQIFSYPARPVRVRGLLSP
jgi:hypothetical protein